MTARNRVLLAGAAAAITLLARPAAAQYGGGGFGAPGGGGMQPAPPMGQEPKEEGPAQEAPEEEGRPPELEPLAGYNEQGRRKLQVVELNGYLRLRSDYMHNFFLGQGYTHVADTAEGLFFGKPPFPTPLECGNPAFPNSTANDPIGNPYGNCGHKNVGGANLRFRIEPTLNVTDQVRVRAQFDVLDNTLLGSTPDSLAGIPGYNRTPTVSAANSSMVPPQVLPTIPPGVAPDSYLYTTMDPPEVGQNGFVSSVRAKRAWAEVDGEFGSIRFGRMPWNWGRGMLFNDGSCPDCDAGTNVDRVMGLTQVYGHQIAVAWDIGTQGFTSQELDIGRNNPGSYPIDLSQNDDVLELMASVSKIDTPVSLRERQDRGELVVNYGLQLVYRNQGNAIQPASINNAAFTVTMTPFGPQPPPRDFIPPTGNPPDKEINAVLFTPDLWFKLYYKALTVEFEGAGVIGKVDHPGYLAVDDTRTTFLQWGYVLASELRLFRDSFFVGLETGGASGDQAEDPSQYLNYRWHFVQQPPHDHSITDFHFNPDYHIDEILWRHIMGTVNNAFYIKPQTSYWFDLGQTRAIGLMGAAIFSIADVPISTPGNALPYGFEMNVGATYRNSAEGFYAGVTWAVLWPFGALDRPQALWGGDAADATAAQLLRVFMGVRF